VKDISIMQINKKRLVALAAAPAALLASGGMVWAASYSAFSATTVNPTSNWTAGTVALSDDDSDTAMFTASNLKPGATGTKCIAVTSTGSLASSVKLYGTSYATTKDLASNINLKVEQGTGATTASCTGFTGASTLYDGTMTAFGTGKTSFSTGVGSWSPTGSASETKSYRITYTLSTSTPDTAQGGTAALGFTWEAQNS
jgi:hypothetical protein